MISVGESDPPTSSFFSLTLRPFPAMCRVPIQQRQEYEKDLHVVMSWHKTADTPRERVGEAE